VKDDEEESHSFVFHVDAQEFSMCITFIYSQDAKMLLVLGEGFQRKCFYLSSERVNSKRMRQLGKELKMGKL